MAGFIELGSFVPLPEPAGDGSVWFTKVAVVGVQRSDLVEFTRIYSKRPEVLATGAVSLSAGFGRPVALLDFAVRVIFYWSD